MASTSLLPYRPRTAAPTTRPTSSAGRRSLRWLGAAILVFAFLAPSAGAVTTGVDPAADAQAKRDQIRQQRADLAGQIDLVRASDNEVAAALNTMDQNVAAQSAKVADAKKAIADADQRVADLSAQLDQNQAAVAEIEVELRKQAIDRYVNPEGSFDAAKMLQSNNFDQAEQRKVLADTVGGSHRDVIDELKGAKAKIADLQQETADARAEADTRRQEEQAQLDQLNNARGEQAKVKAEWDKRLANLGDDDSKLAAEDANLTAIIQQEQAKAAAAAAAAAAAQAQAAAQAKAQAQAADAARAQAAAPTTSKSNGTSPPGTGGGSSTTTAPSGGGTAPAPQPVVSRSGMIWPIAGTVSQEFGHNGHPGIDIFAPFGTAIHAALAGTVIYAQFNNGGYGNLVVIDHGGGFATAYAHQSQIIVSVGQVVAQGQQIGMEGSTGNSTGPHLHFECRVNGSVVNPRNYLP